MYICINDKYCPAAELFDSIEEFLTMCVSLFGVSPMMLVCPDGRVIEIPSGDVVLREVA